MITWLSNNKDAVSAIAAVVSAIFTVAIAFLTFAVWQSYRRLNFITGAMQSHSEKQLRLVATDKRIPVKWGDKTKLAAEPPPSHGDPAPLDVIWLAIPPTNAGCWRRFRNWLAG